VKESSVEPSSSIEQPTESSGSRAEAPDGGAPVSSLGRMPCAEAVSALTSAPSGRPTSLAAAQVLLLQRSVGNAAVSALIRARAEQESATRPQTPAVLLQRAVVCPPGVTPEEGTGCYEIADPVATQSVSSSGAVATPKTPLASTALVPREADAIAAMTAEDKLIAAYQRAKLAPAVLEKLASLITPKALVVAILTFAAVFIASQFTPVGWAADIGILLSAAFVAGSLMSAIDHLIKFADARNATTSEDLDRAGAEFAAAVAEVSVDAVIILVTHSVGGGGRGGAPLEGPPPVRVQLGLTQDGFLIPVAAETVPATIPVVASAGLGAKAAGASTTLMSAMSGSTGPSGGSSSGGRPGPRQVEEAFIERLKERFPKLKQLDMRPRARPSASGYTSRTEPSEVGGSPEYRREVSGAPEHAFEERMQTSQGKFSYNVYRDGKVVFEIDGISVDGWLEEVKIQQNMGRLDEILAQLRIQADFAETYGLKGVRYSIAPPEVAAEVESRVAEEGLRNVFRVE
jgi:hypothetical protein